MAECTELDTSEIPTAWFCLLERSIRTENYERAKEAHAELARLGVEVRFCGKRWERWEGLYLPPSGP